MLPAFRTDIINTAGNADRICFAETYKRHVFADNAACMIYGGP